MTSNNCYRISDVIPIQYNIWRLMYNIWYITSNILHLANIIWCLTLVIWHWTSDFWHMTKDISHAPPSYSSYLSHPNNPVLSVANLLSPWGLVRWLHPSSPGNCMDCTVLVLGQDKGYTVKYSPLPQWRPKCKGLYLIVYPHIFSQKSSSVSQSILDWWL